MTTNIPTDMGPGPERAALALAVGATQLEAGRAARASDRTIRRWMQRDDFQALVASHRSNHVRELDRQLADLQSTAVETLGELLDASQPSNVRLGAVRTVLDYGQRVREEAELLRRIQDLEVYVVATTETSR